MMTPITLCFAVSLSSVPNDILRPIPDELSTPNVVVADGSCGGKAGDLKPIATDTYNDRALDAWTKATNDDKYTVLVFHFGEHDPYSKTQVKNLRDEELAKYSEHIVVSVTDPEVDKGAEEIAVALQVLRYPTVLVLRTDRGKLDVAGRLEGKCSVEKLDAFLKESLKDKIAAAGCGCGGERR